MAHHDHLGLAAERDAQGDNIYNGAVDNASGTAALLAIARACTLLDERPRRSILFAAVGAEEQGLLGSLYLAEHPPTAAGRLAAVINIDGANIIGPTRDVNVIGLGKSNLDTLVEGIARWQNRVVTPDQFPDRGYYYRSDQFSLAKVGVPGVYLHSGVNVIGKPEGWGKQQLEAWVETKYHQPSDEYDESWDLRGAVEDIRLLYYVGLQVAQQPAMPKWNPGDEFEAARKAAINALSP
jgi:Zn-dependent M28 family amino/carboxypeptidase